MPGLNGVVNLAFPAEFITPTRRDVIPRLLPFVGDEVVGRIGVMGGAGGGKGAGVLEFDAAALGVCRDETKPESGREKVIVGAAPCCLETKGDLKGFFPCMLLIPTLVSRLFFTNGVTGICVGEDITFRP